MSTEAIPLFLQKRTLSVCTALRTLCLATLRVVIQGYGNVVPDLRYVSTMLGQLQAPELHTVRLEVRANGASDKDELARMPFRAVAHVLADAVKFPALQVVDIDVFKGLDIQTILDSYLEEQLDALRRRRGVDVRHHKFY